MGKFIMINVHISIMCNKLMNTDDDLESHKSFSEEGFQRRPQSIHNG
jgi:hypothetical protein